jgi:mono/diheme cytochrome c family protein
VSARLALRLRLLLLALTPACGGAGVPSEEHRVQAQTIWKERCSNCHGQFGRGDGPGAKLLMVKPRDFSDRHWKDQADDERIARTIVEGGVAVGLDGNMAANPDLRSKPEVVRALVEIVRGW